MIGEQVRQSVMRPSPYLHIADQVRTGAEAQVWVRVELTLTGQLATVTSGVYRQIEEKLR